MALDVEGAEESIVNTFPFEKIQVDILQLEYMVSQSLYWDRDLSTKRRQELATAVHRRLPDYKEKALVFLDVIYAKD